MNSHSLVVGLGFERDLSRIKLYRVQSRFRTLLLQLTRSRQILVVRRHNGVPVIPVHQCHQEGGSPRRGLAHQQGFPVVGSVGEPLLPLVENVHLKFYF